MSRTRLAPSPTGALHLGNARTFLVNWALARQRDWDIVLRIEDLDGSRIKPDAAAEAIDVLAWLGLDWDEGPHEQRAELAPYREALAALAAAGEVYPCRCTRREIEAASLSAPHADEHELRYPGTCRPRQPLSPEGRGWVRGGALDFPKQSGSDADPTAPQIPPLAPPFKGGELGAAWRLCVPEGVAEFDDAFAGRYRHDVQTATGDFLVATKEGLPSYQLAVVIDDARQRIDHVVRGDDLLASTLRQRLLQERLGLAPPEEYIHLPLVVGPDGRRLAKRHGDSRIAHYRALGVSAERIIGLVAEWCGLGPRREMTACEFAREFLLERMPHERVVFTAADDQWLRNAT